MPSAIVIEAESGTVLFEKNADQLIFPASLAKLMTVETVLDQIALGNLSLDEEYVVSVNAWRKGGAPSGGSTMFAALHSKIKVRDLLSGVIIQSANDACIVLAEGIAGNEAAFARLMNDRARELGLNKSNFTNPTGLPDPEMRVTVRELAKLTQHIIQHLSRTVQNIRRTRVHLEQDPPAESQSAARAEYRRRRAEDRLHAATPVTVSSARRCRTASG